MSLLDKNTEYDSKYNVLDIRRKLADEFYYYLHRKYPEQICYSLKDFDPNIHKMIKLSGYNDYVYFDDFPNIKYFGVLEVIDGVLTNYSYIEDLGNLRIVTKSILSGEPKSKIKYEDVKNYLNYKNRINIVNKKLYFIGKCYDYYKKKDKNCVAEIIHGFFFKVIAKAPMGVFLDVSPSAGYSRYEGNDSGAKYNFQDFITIGNIKLFKDGIIISHKLF